MSLKQKFVSAITLAFAITGFTLVASAQDKTATPDATAAPEKHERMGPGRHGEGRAGNGEGRGGPGMRGGPRGPEMMLRALHQVGLTDAQKEQIHTILESKRAGFEQAHEQMRELGRAKHEGTITAEQEAQLKAFHEKMRENTRATHEQILGILTAEQRAKLEQMKQEMEKRKAERRERGPRPGRGEGPPPPTDKPADKPTDN